MRRIKSRSVIYIMTASIIPIFAFLLYTVIFVSNQLLATAIDVNDTKIDWSSQYLNQYTEQLKDIVYLIHLEDNLLELVDQSGNEYADIEEIVRDNLYNNSNILSSVTIISLNTYRGVSFEYEKGFTSKLYSYDDLELNPSNEVEGLKFYNDGKSIYALHTINDFDTQHLDGVILLRLNPRLNDELLNILESDSSFLLYSLEHTLIANNVDETDFDTVDLAEHSGVLYEKANSYVWTNKVGKLDLYVSLVVEKSDVESVSRNMMSVGAIIMVLSFGISFLTSIFFSNDITSPIIHLTEHMKKAKLEKLEHKSSKYEEVKVLENTYNDMIEELNHLITEKYQSEIERQNIQLKALQAQINPHFLSNTFQLIGGMALEHGSTDIYEATIKMSKLVRYSMRIDQKAVMLKEELIHINDYLDIQKLRFGNRLEYRVDVNSAIEQVLIPKFTIQPILENSFKHGLKKMEGLWVISVTTEVLDRITIKISDNGKGMKQEELVKLNKLFDMDVDIIEKVLPDVKSIGLVNIDSRIKLLYGKKYGLQVESNLGSGLTVNIHLPLNGVKK